MTKYPPRLPLPLNSPPGTQAGLPHWASWLRFLSIFYYGFAVRPCSGWWWL